MMNKPLKPGEKRERKDNKMMIKIFIGMIILITCLIAWEAVFAHGGHSHDIDIDNSTTNNYYSNSDTDGCMCLSNGLSEGDMSRALSLAMTAGAHELDWSTTDWQGSITYALQVDDEEEGAYSAKLGKKWKSVPALFHVTFVPEQGQDFGNWLIVGGTFRF